MPVIQAVWTAGLLALPLLVLLGFMRRRARTLDYTESRAVKAQLPWWVKNCETLLMLAFGYLWAAVSFKLYALLRGSQPERDMPLVGAAAFYVIIGIAFIVIPIAMLSANAVSEFIPFLRKANQKAFRGTHVSFKSANAGLLKFAAVSVPFGMMATLIAAIEPWRH